MISKYRTNQENHPSFDRAAWCVVSGWVTKGRIYGTPRMLKSIVNTTSSSHSYSVESSYPSSSYRALQKEREKRWFYFGYHGGTSNIGQGMPAPMAPSMPSHMAL
jgi:hypothetical protein